MGKKQAVQDLDDDVLGEPAAPAKKAAAKKKAAKEAPAAPAKKAAAKGKAEEPAAPAKKAAAKEVAPSVARKREPLEWEEGEKDAVRARVKKLVKKPINTRDLAAKLDVPTRKLRTVLYSMARAEELTLESGESRVGGMTVSPA